MSRQKLKVALLLAPVALLATGCTVHVLNDPGPTPTQHEQSTDDDARRTEHRDAPAPSPTPSPHEQDSGGTIVGPFHRTDQPTTDEAAAASADQAFWDAYATGDFTGACSRAAALLSDGTVVPFTTGPDVLQVCVDMLGSSPTAGTDLTAGTPVVHDGVAMVPVSGTSCGVEATPAGSCETVPDLSGFMPTSDDDFDDAAAGIWTATDWYPDLVVDDAGRWVVLLPFADQSTTDDQQDQTQQDQSTQPDQSGTDSPLTGGDWNDICASGGCSGVPGLPAYVNGGGLKF